MANMLAAFLLSLGFLLGLSNCESASKVVDSNPGSAAGDDQPVPEEARQLSASQGVLRQFREPPADGAAFISKLERLIQSSLSDENKNLLSKDITAQTYDNGYHETGIRAVKLSSWQRTPNVSCSLDDGRQTAFQCVLENSSAAVNGKWFTKPSLDQPETQRNSGDFSASLSFPRIYFNGILSPPSTDVYSTSPFEASFISFGIGYARGPKSSRPSSDPDDTQPSVKVSLINHAADNHLPPLELQHAIEHDVQASFLGALAKILRGAAKLA